ncbi:MAG: hypothetical protein PVH65_12465 [Chloroflexota bacterium]
MTRRKRVSHRPTEEKLRAKNRAKKSDSDRGAPVHQIARQLNDNRPGSANPGSIKALQQSVGNRVVSRLVSSGAGAGPAVQREATIPASEEKELAGAGTTKNTTPGVAGPAPSPLPNMAQPPGATSTPKVASGSKMGSSMGDEPGTMKGLTSATTVSNDPGQSNAAVKPSAGIVSIQAPGSEEGTQAPPTAPPQQEEQETS